PSWRRGRPRPRSGLSRQVELAAPRGPMGQGFAACADAGGCPGGDEASLAARAALAPGAAAEAPRDPEEPLEAGEAGARAGAAQQAGRADQAAESATSQLSGETSRQSRLSWDTPRSQVVRQTSAKTPSSPASSEAAPTQNSSASFANWMDLLKAQRRRRLQTEPEVQKFLQAHGYSDVDQLRQASRWGAAPACRPLHLAVAHGDAAMVGLLLLHGADPTLPDGLARLPGGMCGASRRAQCGWEEWEAARRAAQAAAAHVLRHRAGARRPRPQAVPGARQPLARGPGWGAAGIEWPLPTGTTSLRGSGGTRCCGRPWLAREPPRGKQSAHEEQQSGAA
ncbi:unnamed protein product, partial [Prorocentrum cordatum]